MTDYSFIPSYIVPYRNSFTLVAFSFPLFPSHAPFSTVLLLPRRSMDIIRSSLHLIILIMDSGYSYAFYSFVILYPCVPFNEHCALFRMSVPPSCFLYLRPFLFICDPYRSR